MQIISQEKVLPWGLIVLKESDLNGYCPKGVIVTFWKRVGFENEKGKMTYWCMPIVLPLILFSISSHFFSVFFLIFFLFFYSIFLFTPRILCFSVPLRAQQDPFYSACRDQCFTTLPLNRLCLVWAYLPTTKSVKHSPLPDKGRFVSFLSLP